jgi:uncharacterized protein (DUF2147 family)
MQRLVTALGLVIALIAMAPAAKAGSYVFSVGGHRVQIEALRNCRSAACVSVSSQRTARQVEDVVAPPAASPPATAIAPPPPRCAAAPGQPAPVVAVTPPAPPVLAAAASQPVAAPPPAPDPLPLAPARLDPPRADVPAPVATIQQVATMGQRGDDDPTSPLGEWESVGASGSVRIERCGQALCGYTLTDASRRGESVLVNMKPRSSGVWAGSVYSRASGNTYYGTMTLKPSGRLHVEACALGRFVCSGNDWRRVDEPGRMVTTSRSWSARS